MLINIAVRLLCWDNFLLFLKVFLSILEVSAEGPWGLRPEAVSLGAEAWGLGPLGIERGGGLEPPTERLKK